MTEQEKMQQEALATEALEEVSGGKLTKDDVKRYWNNTKKFVSDHKVGVGAAAVAIAALAVEGGGRKFKDVKTLANAIRGFLPNASGSQSSGQISTPAVLPDVGGGSSAAPVTTSSGGEGEEKSQDLPEDYDAGLED